MQWPLYLKKEERIMAYIKTHFFSTALCFGTDINVFIPTPDADELLTGKKNDYFVPGVKYQVLYLLHGAYGDYTDWLHLTSIERYAQDHKLAVIMPSAANSFYQNMNYGSDYLTYISEELPKFCEANFPISTKREDTFVAGLSMGGYGALKIALERPDKFSCAASLSGAIDLDAVIGMLGSMPGSPFDYAVLFGDKKVAGSDADLFQMIKDLKAAGKPLPKVYQAIGTEDFLYEANQSAKQKLEALGVDLTYEEGPGIHNWIFWDAYIQRALNWLPLKNAPL